MTNEEYYFIDQVIDKLKVNKRLLLKAIGYVNSYCQGHVKYLLEVAEIIAAIHLSSEAIIAGILWYVEKDTAKIRQQEISDLFGDKIVRIIDGFDKLSTVQYLPHNTIQAQKFFDLLDLLQQDVAREVLIAKLAYLIHNVSIFNVNSNSKDYTVVALEIMEIYLPLLAKLGLKEVKSELQEFCFKILQSDTKEYIEKYLEDTILNNNIEEPVKEITSNLNNHLREVSIKAEVQGRVKSTYSIWLKMLKKNTDIEKLYDILAFRIIVNDVQECYMVLDIIRQHYLVISQKFKDYIVKPKANGYQSLHLVMIGLKGQKIELQIRTKSMHYVAERGVAAHWQYKGRLTDIKEKLHIVYQHVKQAIYSPFVSMFIIPRTNNKLSFLQIHKLESSNKNVSSEKSFNTGILITRNLLNEKVQEIINPVVPNISINFHDRRIISITNPVQDNFDQKHDIKVEKIRAILPDNTKKKEVAPEKAKDNIDYNVKQGQPVIKLKDTSLKKVKLIEYRSEPDNNERHIAFLVRSGQLLESEKGMKKILPLVQKPEEIDVKEESQEKFFQAVQEGKTQIVEDLIKHGDVDINGVYDDGYTALIKAIGNDDLEMIKQLLVDPYIDVNKSIFESGSHNLAYNSSSIFNSTFGREGDSPFLAAVRKGNIHMVELFLECSSIDIEQKNQNDQTALIIAAICGNVEVLVKALQNKFKDNVEKLKQHLNHTDHDTRSSALYYALDYSRCDEKKGIKMIQILLAVKDQDQRSLASTKDGKPVIDIKKDNYGHIVEYNNDEEIENFLRDYVVKELPEVKDKVILNESNQNFQFVKDQHAFKIDKWENFDYGDHKTQGTNVDLLAEMLGGNLGTEAWVAFKNSGDEWNEEGESDSEGGIDDLVIILSDKYAEVKPSPAQRDVKELPNKEVSKTNKIADDSGFIEPSEEDDYELTGDVRE